MENTARYAHNFIHGIPNDAGTGDYVGIWRSFLKFIGIKSQQDAYTCVLIDKDPKAENGSLNWFHKQVLSNNSSVSMRNNLTFCFDHIQDFDITLDLSYFLRVYQPFLTDELIVITKKLVFDHLNSQHKCGFDQITSPTYHCAL